MNSLSLSTRVVYPSTSPSIESSTGVLPPVDERNFHPSMKVGKWALMMQEFHLLFPPCNGIVLGDYQYNIFYKSDRFTICVRLNQSNSLYKPLHSDENNVKINFLLEALQRHFYLNEINRVLPLRNIFFESDFFAILEKMDGVDLSSFISALFESKSFLNRCAINIFEPAFGAAMSAAKKYNCSIIRSWDLQCDLFERCQKMGGAFGAKCLSLLLSEGECQEEWLCQIFVKKNPPLHSIASIGVIRLIVSLAIQRQSRNPEFTLEFEEQKEIFKIDHYLTPHLLRFNAPMPFVHLFVEAMSRGLDGRMFTAMECRNWHAAFKAAACANCYLLTDLDIDPARKEQISLPFRWALEGLHYTLLSKGFATYQRDKAEFVDACKFLKFNELDMWVYVALKNSDDFDLGGFQKLNDAAQEVIIAMARQFMSDHFLRKVCSFKTCHSKLFTEQELAPYIDMPTEANCLDYICCDEGPHRMQERGYGSPCAPRLYDYIDSLTTPARLDEWVEREPLHLLSRGINGDTPLFSAVRQQNVALARHILEIGKELHIAEVPNDERYLPLMEALLTDDFQMAQVLIDGGAHINARVMGFKRRVETPLTKSFYYDYDEDYDDDLKKSIDRAKWLLRRGARLDISTYLLERYEVPYAMACAALQKEDAAAIGMQTSLLEFIFLTHGRIRTKKGELPPRVIVSLIRQHLLGDGGGGERDYSAFPLIINIQPIGKKEFWLPL